MSGRRIYLSRCFPVGTRVWFHAYDRERYEATVIALRHGVVTITYRVHYRPELITAYLQRAEALARLTPLEVYV